MSEIRRDKVPSNPISEKYYEKFKYKLEEVSEKNASRNMMIFYLDVATGFRLQDIIGLTVGEIKEALENEEFCIQEQKQYKAYLKHKKKNPNSTRRVPKKRTVVIKPKLRKLLKSYVRDRKKSEYAFKSNKGEGYITAKAYSNILANVGQLIGLDNISGHSLRKTYATRIYDMTGDLNKVRKALNHKSIETTKQYLGLDEEVRDEAASIADEKL